MTGLDARVAVHRPGFRLDVALELDAGEVGAVMGPSGAGKSTLLGALAGLVALDDGRIAVGGRVLDEAPDPRRSTEPSKRGVVLLRQDPRVFPHLTARANVEFGLRVRGAGRTDAQATAQDWLDRVGLGALADRRPADLSGGQQQRVALARALATDPDVLLLDEPLSSLDTETAADIRALLREQLRATGTTAIVATHDAVDAVALADRLFVLEAGTITQRGATRDVLAAPATRFAAAVAGLNRVEGQQDAAGWRAGPLRLPASGADGALAAVFRPGDVRLIDGDPAGPGEWSARVIRLEPTPAGVRVRTAEPDVAVDVAADRATGLEPGALVTLRVSPADVRFAPV